MCILNVIGETTLDIGPGAEIWIAAGSCPGMVVCVKVARGVGLSVGLGVFVGWRTGVRAKAVSVAEMLAASAVHAITVGRYSGGYAVGIGLAAGAVQPAKSPRREASRIRFRFIQSIDISTTVPQVFSMKLRYLRETLRLRSEHRLRDVFNI